MWELIGKAAVALVAARLGLSILKGIYGSFLAAALGLNLKVKKTGEWAGKAKGSGRLGNGLVGAKESVVWREGSGGKGSGSRESGQVRPGRQDS